MTIASILLIALLVVYAVAGGAFAFNAMGISERAARRYQNYPWLLPQIGRDNALVPQAGQ